MRLVFVDDSEQSQPRRQGLGHLIALGAVIVPGEQVLGLGTDLSAIKAGVGVPAAEEIKWKPPKNSFLASAGGKLVADLRQHMLDAALEHGVRTVVTIIDHTAAYTSKTNAEVGKELLKWIFERVSMALDDAGDFGVVIADRPGGGSATEGRWLADSIQLTSDGTEYVTPGRIVMPIVTAPSHHVPHLQLADLVVAATTSAIAGYPAGLKLGSRLASLMHRHSLGDVNGAGFVMYPKNYYNLLLHAFGETGASLPSAQAGYTLPYQGFPYYDDDGLPA